MVATVDIHPNPTVAPSKFKSTTTTTTGNCLGWLALALRFQLSRSLALQLIYLFCLLQHERRSESRVTRHWLRLSRVDCLLRQKAQCKVTSVMFLELSDTENYLKCHISNVSLAFQILYQWLYGPCRRRTHRSDCWQSGERSHKWTSQLKGSRPSLKFRLPHKQHRVRTRRRQHCAGRLAVQHRRRRRTRIRISQREASEANRNRQLSLSVVSWNRTVVFHVVYIKGIKKCIYKGKIFVSYLYYYSNQFRGPDACAVTGNCGKGGA